MTKIHAQVLPTEILAEILTSTTLTHADLGRCALVCKLFRDIVQRYTRCSYNLRIGHPSQQTWRLVRALLLNPQIGERFTSITVIWAPPKQSITDSGPQLLRWNWTPAEKEKIFAFAGRVLKEPVLRGVYSGVDCGSLIPLLLCFMSNLQTLDLGIDSGLCEAYLNAQIRAMVRENVGRWGKKNTKV